MRPKKTVHVPASTHEEDTAVICDICGKEGDPDERDPFGVEGGYGNVDECTIRREYGFDYDEDYGITCEEFDVCPNCWKNVLAPLFKNPPSRRII